ncbi:hypothetical protein BGX24_006938 [Mortierella sp. AD032]|nr:hypothetical protein BGX24_006938 [Mortierella sp. AD032]
MIAPPNEQPRITINIRLSGAAEGHELESSRMYFSVLVLAVAAFLMAVQAAPIHNEPVAVEPGTGGYPSIVCVTVDGKNECYEPL